MAATFLHQGCFGWDSIPQEVGLDTKHYNIQSFRIGATTSAHDDEICDANIQMLGCWKSNAYKLCIHMPGQNFSLTILASPLLGTNESELPITYKPQSYTAVVISNVADNLLECWIYTIYYWL